MKTTIPICQDPLFISDLRCYVASTRRRSCIKAAPLNGLTRDSTWNPYSNMSSRLLGDIFLLVPLGRAV